MLVYHKQSLNIWIAVLQVTFLYSGVISIEKLIVGVMAGMWLMFGSEPGPGQIKDYKLVFGASQQNMHL